MPLEPKKPRERGFISFEKPSLSLAELVDRFEGRGLVIPDRARAERYVRHTGYFRLSPYAIPSREDPSAEKLREGTKFDDVLDRHVFDRALRLLMMDALERIEVAV
jgi:abortive infection bacteriophage resistance protein